ncbi:portal protein [Rhizobium phage RHph_TM3_14A]|nr:portal protein [Rhizobium phage RHph_TM27A]QIG66937.1 portal protein [Rhizobium phage RHph_TM27B]QIG67027.1 portal protein [Rhizobium phage RHph_TM29]QIG67482.1 portal protein [Rhizobium phage RHph_TM3_14A]
MATKTTNHNIGLLRVIPGPELEEQIAAQDKANYEARTAASQPSQSENNLASHIRTIWEQMKRHRNSGSGWSDRLIQALRTFNGQYDPEKLSQIREFGGSEIYARIVAMKCRGSSSLLRDVYLTPDRPWDIDPPADPDVPDEIVMKIGQLIDAEVQQMSAQGMAPSASAIRDRFAQLMEAARGAEMKAARGRAKLAKDKIDEILESGGFYKALAEFIVDLPLFPFACIKGPIVKMVPTVKWVQGQPQASVQPRLFWNRISPFDLWFTPGVADIEDAAVVERSRVTRADLNDLLDLPGYNADQIRSVLRDYGQSGYVETVADGSESERAQYENRESPTQNHSLMIDMLEYNGNIQGILLLQYGMTTEQVPDPLRDYMVQAFVIGRYVIKVQLTPSPRKRHPYYITSFEKVPGTPVGNALPDILSDIQEASNATLRALINNMSIASGPQVVIRDDMASGDNDSDVLYPWKRWHVQGDMMGGAGQTMKPVDFFQPTMNAQELLGVYTKFGEIADELSAIPRHMSGANPGGGAGRTASGLAMLMGNASKILQTVAANIDRDVMEPLLMSLYDMIMLTDTTGILNGDENIRVMGVNVATQRETQRQRQIEFLQVTANPMDAQIIGIPGRAKVLRSVASEIGLDGEGIVPPDDQLAASIQQTQASGVAPQPQGAGGGQAPSPASPAPRANVT